MLPHHLSTMSRSNSNSLGQSSNNNSGLSSVVQNLVRHQFGASAMDVPATDLDQYVADMLVKEAKERKEKWNQEGMSAYLSDEEQCVAGWMMRCRLYKPQTDQTCSWCLRERPQRRTNKRFLLNMMRNVDDHNAALTRQEEEERRVKEASSGRRDQGASRSAGGPRSLFAMAKSSIGGPTSSKERSARRVDASTVSNSSSTDPDPYTRDREYRQTSRPHEVRNEAELSRRRSRNDRYVFKGHKGAGLRPPLAEHH